MNETTIVYNSQKSGYLAKCWSLTQTQTQTLKVAMPWYSVNTSIMIKNLRAHCPMVKQVWLADDSGGGRIAQLYDWYKQLSKEGEKFGERAG